MAAKRKARAKAKTKAKAKRSGARARRPRPARALPVAPPPRFCSEDGSLLDPQGRCQNPDCPRFGQVQPPAGS